MDASHIIPQTQLEKKVAIRVKCVSKSFASQNRGLKEIKALDGVTIDILEGEILGILGPNGAGKTTFLNILSTLLLPDSGTIEMLGIKLVPRNFDHLRSLLNMSSGYPNFPWSLTAVENLKFFGRLYGLSGQALNAKVNKLIEMFGLGNYAQQRFEELSSGTKQRLALAKALLNDPKIIFFDEPTVGLDPDVAEKTREIIRRIFQETKATILLTTHNMQEAEQMCQRIAFIKEGRVIKLATPQELKVRQGKKDLEEVFIELARQITVFDPGIKEATKIVAMDIGAQQWGKFSFKALFQNIMAWFNRCYAFTCRNYIFAIRNVFAFAELVFWPIVTLLSIGLMGNFLQLGDKAFSFIMTGAIAGGILQVTQLDVAYSLLYEVWSKSMKHTFLTPVGISENLFGSWVNGIVRGTAIFFILGTAAVVFFDFRFPPMGVTIFFLLGMFCCSLLLGLLVSYLILLFGQKAEITAWMFAYLFMLLCGIYYPVDTLPGFFYHLAQLIPITYFLEYFRQSFGFHSSFDNVLLRGFGLVVFYLAFGLLMMKHAFYQARKKGIIVRLSE